MVNILVVDDDPEIIDLLRLDLELMGFHVDSASDGLTALKKAEAKTYDLIVLDVMMPKLDGFEVCKRIRATRSSASVPIVLLTAKGTIEDKIRGFNAGADDYLVKPFEFQELMVRMRALFRRTGTLNKEVNTPKKDEVLSAGEMRLIPSSLEVVLKGQIIKLTPTEFEILYCLMQHVGEAVSLATLLQEVWGYEADEDVRMLRVHVGGLRQKIERDHKHPVYLQTVTNVGYRLNPFVEAATTP
ncbi:response regulator transcription factor [Vampirovibrio chlorellavorus]|uniref:response regulator transcription factor n=1 Tax=Vampirovibrio chlorellavorus TaxID=758823 RepID=UPI0026EA5592|nr:response regulator transcription factor [Vampirovibrio chlorellavorus]